MYQPCTPHPVAKCNISISTSGAQWTAHPCHWVGSSNSCISGCFWVASSWTWSSPPALHCLHLPSTCPLAPSSAWQFPPRRCPLLWWVLPHCWWGPPPFAPSWWSSSRTSVCARPVVPSSSPAAQLTSFFHPTAAGCWRCASSAICSRFRVRGCMRSAPTCPWLYYYLYVYINQSTLLTLARSSMYLRNLRVFLSYSLSPYNNPFMCARCASDLDCLLWR